jgi:hypothetical protein
MGSPLSPVIANFYMEVFEEMALNQAPHKPLCWFRYVDDTFVIWPHSPDRLKDFLDHLNGIHQNIQFTMEMERDGHLPFLDIDIYRRPDGSLGHRVYHKPTHTNLYLNSSSHHHQTSMPYSPHWYTEQELCATRTAFMESWCSWVIFSGRTVTLIGRFAEPSTLP